MRALLLTPVLLVALSGIGSCSKHSGKAPPQEPSGCGAHLPGASASGASSSPPPSASAAALPASTFELDRGCAGDIDPKLSAQDQLKALERYCTPGMSRLTSVPSQLTLDPKAPTETQLTLNSQVCLRIAIVLQSGQGPIEISLVDPQGVELRRIQSASSPALWTGQGPVCLGQAGSYKVRVRAGQDAKSALFAVWTSTPTNNQTK